MSSSPELRARERRVAVLAGTCAVLASVAGLAGFRLLAPLPTGGPAPQARSPLASATDTQASTEPPAPPASTHRVEGRVLDDTGKPIASVKLEARCGPYSALSALSDAEGRFALANVPVGPCVIAADAERHERSVLPELDVPLERPLLITLARASGVEGRVIGVDGAPAAEVTITLAGSGVWPPREVTSDAEGAFRFTELPPGVYALQARSSDAVSDPADGVETRPAEAAFVTLLLVAGSALEVVVSDGLSGKPIAGAKLSVVEHGLLSMPQPATTDDVGLASFGGLRPTPHRVVVEAEGYVPHASLQTPGIESVRIALEPAATVAGRVVDTRGEPIAGADLELLAAGSQLGVTGALSLAAGDNLGVTLGSVPKIPLGDARPMALLPSLVGGAVSDPNRAQAFRSDDQGRFRLTPVPAGALRVLARHPGFAPAQSEPVQARAGQTVAGVTITLSLGGRVVGTVVDEHGAPRPATRVDLSLAEDPLGRSTVSGSGGSFVFDTVQGRGVLTASATGLAPVTQNVEIAPGAEVEVTLALAGDATELSGDVTGALGEPLSDAVLRVTGCGEATALARTAVTDSMGSFAIEGLPKLPCTLEVEHPDHVPIELEAVPGAARLAIELRRGLELEAELIDPHSGEPVRGARAVLTGQGRSVRAQSNGRGKIEISSVNYGDYELSISHPGYVTNLLEVSVRADESSTDLGVIELAPAGSVGGDVVDGFGSVIAGALVSVVSSRGRGAGARTGGDGAFRLGGLAPGPHLLQARAPDGQLSDTAEVRALAGETVGGVVLRFEGRVDESASDETSAAEAREASAGRGSDAPTSGEHEAQHEGQDQHEGLALELAYAEGQVRIGRVIGAEAKRAGLRTGDRLESIDGEAVLVVSQARSLARGAAGTHARLVVSRAGQQLSLRVMRERYVP